MVLVYSKQNFVLIVKMCIRNLKRSLNFLLSRLSEVAKYKARKHVAPTQREVVGEIQYDVLAYNVRSSNHGRD